MMKRYVLFLLLSAVLVSATKAQVSYNFIATSGTFSSIAATGTHPTLVSPDVAYSPTDEGYANAVPIGFSFAYNGANYTTVNINANGYLTLGSPFAADPGETYYYDSLAGGPVSLPSARPVIAPFWSDLDVQAATNMTYTVTGSSPNRVFVVEWSSALWDYSATTASISFQAKLYETTNIIQFIYQQESGTPSGARAKIGLTASGVGTGNFLSLSDATGAATVSSTIEGEIFSRPATGQMYIFAPLSCLPPSTLTITNQTGTSATVSWPAVTGALGYEYATGTTATPPTGAGTTTTATTANLTGLSAGINYVFVRTQCSATTFSLWTVKAIIPCTTNLLPANGATGVAIPPTISWSPVAGCDSYTIMFSTDGITYTALGNVPSTSTSVSVPGTVANTTYWWYIRATLGSDTASTTCVANATSFTTLGTGGVPPNDNECNAIALTLNGPSDCENTALATVEANETGVGVLSCSTPNNTVWYTYTPVTSGIVKVIMKRNVGATTDLDGWVGFFTTSGTCPALTLTQVGTCGAADLTVNDSVIITSATLTAGTKYYIMIDGFLGAIGEFCIRLTEPPPPPPNDECTGAINLPDGVPVPGTTVNATQTLAANLCNGATGIANDDVWYSITALNNGDATITLIPDGAFDAVLEAFSGTCGTLTSIACRDDSAGGQIEIMPLTGLTAGQVVYIRVFEYGAAGTEGTFTIHATGTALLPVKLTSFRGEKTGSKNILTWSTASEQNNRGFELQRSADGENFSSMVFVPSKGANGNSSTALSYQFADEKPFSGNSYYRLKQVDYDGKVIYSNIVLIKGTRITSITMSAVYPNPVKETLKVVLAAPGASSISLVVTDLAGKLLMQQSARLIAGDNSFSVDVKQLPSGSYLIKAVCTNGCETTVSKFVKQ